jgi:hypothetical protein
VKVLEELKDIRKTGVKKTKAGFEAAIYELTAKAYLAMIHEVTDLDYLLSHLDEHEALALLGSIVGPEKCQ